MTKNTSNPTKVFASRQQVTAALERAAARARAIATQTGTELIVSASPQAMTSSSTVSPRKPA